MEALVPPENPDLAVYPVTEAGEVDTDSSPMILLVSVKVWLNSLR